jgi:hypothetical protein
VTATADVAAQLFRQMQGIDVLDLAARVPTSLAQEPGSALGAQAGEKRLAEVIRSGGFTRVRRAAQTPLNMVLEAI